MNRAELVTKLELVGRALADSNLIPLFQCFVFDGTHVSANNDQLAIIAPCATEDAFAVNGQVLLGLLKASRAPEVEFQRGENHDIVVMAGKSHFRLPYHPKEEFLFKEPEQQWDVAIDLGAHMVAGLHACLLTASKDSAQPALMGVFLKQARTLYSCDGDALSRYQLDQKTKSHVLVDFMMPTAFCETTLKIISEMQGTVNEVAASVNRLELNRGWAKTTVGGWYTIYGRLIENDHPLDHEALIAKTLKAEPAYTAIPEGLDHALSRARVVADPESKPTQLTVEGNKLHLVTDTHLGTVRDVLPFKHPDVVALVSAELMQRSIELTTEMSILENCCCFNNGLALFQLLSNYG